MHRQYRPANQPFLQSLFELPSDRQFDLCDQPQPLSVPDIDRCIYIERQGVREEYLVIRTLDTPPPPPLTLMDQAVVVQ